MARQTSHAILLRDVVHRTYRLVADYTELMKRVRRSKCEGLKEDDVARKLLGGFSPTEMLAEVPREMRNGGLNTVATVYTYNQLLVLVIEKGFLHCLHGQYIALRRGRHRARRNSRTLWRGDVNPGTRRQEAASHVNKWTSTVEAG
jgi:hypothetical protein